MVLVVFANAQTDYYCEGDNIWPDTAAGRSRTLGCTIGYLERNCIQINDHEAAWGEIIDNGCSCGKTADVPVDIQVKPNEIATLDCMSGSILVPCNATGWYNYNEVDFNTCACTDEGMFPGVSTESTSTSDCTYGQASRYCSWGFWEEADYSMCFNVGHNCTRDNYLNQKLLISPEFQSKDLYENNQTARVCVYPIEYYSKEPWPTREQIKENGLCEYTSSSSIPTYFFDFHLPRSGHYWLHVIADVDDTPVPIPALTLREDKEAYLALIRTAACILEPTVIDSTTTTINIAYIVTWPFYFKPKVNIYYTDTKYDTPYNSTLLLVTKDISEEDYYFFETGDQLIDLKNNTEYYIYIIGIDGHNETFETPMVPNMIIGHTYDYCVGIEEDNTLEYGLTPVLDYGLVPCSKGSVQRLCNKGPNWTAWYGEEINECYCTQAIIYDHMLDETKYKDSYPIECGNGPASVPCLFKGIWGEFEGCSCGPNDDIWQGEDRNITEVYFCDTGSMIRECPLSGFWLDPINIRCQCRADDYWPPTNVNTQYNKQCSSGSRSRNCNKFGQWEEPSIDECYCSSMNKWPMTPADTTYTLECPVGSSSRYCDISGHWEDINYSQCSCRAEGDWEETAAGTTATISCGSGSITRFCSIYGIWDAPSTNNCQCESNNIWPATDAGTTATVPCTSSDSSSTATMTRKCNSKGQWESTADTSNCYQTCSQNGVFYPTSVGHTLTSMCPNNVDFVELECTLDPISGPTWSEPVIYGDCNCPYDGIWSPVPAGQYTIINCDIGYKYRYCNPYLTGWDDVIDFGCRCAAENGLDITTSGQSVEIPCGKGSKKATCSETGSWDMIDISTCSCTSSPIYGEAVANSTKYSYCPEEGYRTIECNINGQWENENLDNCQCKIPDILKDIYDSLPLGSHLTTTCADGTGYEYQCDSDGNTEVIQNDCSCAADPERGLIKTSAGTTYIQTCGVGRIQARCNGLGQWENYINSCYCPTTGSYESVAIGQWSISSQYSCQRRYCQEDRTWSDIDYSQCSCGGNNNPLWTEGKVGEYVQNSNECGEGYIQGLCSKSGIINLDYSQCRCASDSLRQLQSITVGEIHPSIECSSGYSSYQCVFNGHTEWKLISSTCLCEQYVDGIEWPLLANVGSFYHLPCGSGMAVYECLPNGVFSQPDNSQCRCKPEYGFEATLAGSSSTMDCPNDISGTTKIVRDCLEGGIWEDITSATSYCKCQPEGYYLLNGESHYTYPETSANNVVSVTCPSDATRTVDRVCDIWGNWGSTQDNLCPSYCAADGVWGSVLAVQSIDNNHPELAAKYTCHNGKTILRWCLLDNNNNPIWQDADWTDCGCNSDTLSDAVLYSTSTEYTQSVEMNCEIGSYTRECKYGRWEEPDYTNCQCAAPEDTTYIYENTNPNTYILYDCTTGFVAQYCGPKGQWIETNAINTCSCNTQIVEGTLELPLTPAGTTYTHSCDSGNKQYSCGVYGDWETLPINNNCQCMNNDITYAINSVLQNNCQKENTYAYSICLTTGHFGVSNVNTCQCYEDSFWGEAVANSKTTTTCSSQGTLTRECLVTGWSSTITNDNCYCTMTGFEDTNLGTTGNGSCDEYYDGNKYAKCLMNGYYDTTIDNTHCIPYCPIDNEWQRTKPDSTATLSCPDGQYGSITRYCNPDGTWSTDSITTCTFASCPADNGFTSVVGGQTASKNCEDGYSGSITRRCNNDGTWEVEDNSQCIRIICSDDEDEALSNTVITKLCPTGYIGSIKKTCNNDGTFSIVDTCTLLMCPAVVGLVSSKPYNTTVQVSCPVGYTGFQTLRCNSLGNWDTIYFECSLILPTLTCRPSDQAIDVSRTSLVNNIYTISCESNVPILNVNNDNNTLMNVYLTFTTSDSHLIYPTTSIKTSEYIYSFDFIGNLPSNAEGYLFIQHSTFDSEYYSFPMAPQITKFTTIGGLPLAPIAIDSSLITIQTINIEEGTADIIVTCEYDNQYHDNAEIVIGGSYLQPIEFVGKQVTISGLFLSSEVELYWRVHNTYGWSDYSSITAYTPVSRPGQPGKPTISTYAATTIDYTWTPAAEYGESISYYTYQVYYTIRGALRNGPSGQTETNTVSLTFRANQLVSIIVIACSTSGCGPESERSDEYLIPSTLKAPSSPENLAANAYSASSVKLTWSEPTTTGGTQITGYYISQYLNDVIIYSTTTTSMNIIIDAENGIDYVYTVYASNSVGDSQSAVITYQLPEYLETFKGYYSDGVITVAVKSPYSLYLSCILTKQSDPTTSYTKTSTVSKNILTKYSYSYLEADTIYNEVCTINEIKSGYVFTKEMSHKTLKTPDVLPIVINSALTSRGSFYNLYVAYDYAGIVTCTISNNMNDEPMTPEEYNNYETYGCSMEHNADGCVLDFLTDNNGNTFTSGRQYYFWCYHERTVVVNNVPTTYLYPENNNNNRRRLLSIDDSTESMFDIISITPSEYSLNINPHDPIEILFNDNVMGNDGKITLYSNSGDIISITGNSKNVICKNKQCSIYFTNGLMNNETYALSIESNAFINKVTNQPLIESINQYIFQTGKKSCTPDYIVSGLEDNRLCQCYSIEDKCECACGSTMILRDL
ncbi:hypothetical protein WA158_002446 [Blastocystis sp. Blastoise]